MGGGLQRGGATGGGATVGGFFGCTGPFGLKYVQGWGLGANTGGGGFDEGGGGGGGLGGQP